MRVLAPAVPFSCAPLTVRIPPEVIVIETFLRQPVFCILVVLALLKLSCTSGPDDVSLEDRMARAETTSTSEVVLDLPFD